MGGGGVVGNNVRFCFGVFKKGKETALQFFFQETSFTTRIGG